ncbi:serine hydrolase domain-containing protein [Thalassoglobus polymorphus]|uniref:Putative periplasmic esterase n=1 Tax=Thalassoglobus polymorphus TaxID=2527994 RepID=A0A517QS66_9PLAN|nr:serine hydrolase [Thalassoglobus polymorphus]QDT34452.1 putative periplasmic esterase [Thalassoglobus polymorphus]
MVHKTGFCSCLVSTIFLVVASVAWGQQSVGDELRSSALELRRHFGEQQFSPPVGFILRQGQQLPELVWEHPHLVSQVLDDATIPTRWFNDQFEAVQVASEPGRYYAYGEAPVPDGPPLRRAMTCCCVVKSLDLTKFAHERLTEKSLGTVEAGKNSDRQREEATALLDRWKKTEAGAVELAALLDSDRPASSLRPGQLQMENATRHVRLKRKLMGIDQTPLVKAVPKKLTGASAPTLHNGPLDQTGISEEQVQELKLKLDEWYAASQEPMAVVVAQDGVVVLSQGYGEVEGDKATVNVTVNTPMRLDSAMKPLIGLQLAMYVDQGAIQLDEPIGNFLPDFNSAKDRNLTFRAGHVHATGIHFPWELAFRRLFYFHAWNESLIAHCPREWNPGSKSRYGVVGVILSVRSLELLRGRNYWDAMERDMFSPLGIHDMLPGGTGFSAEDMARIGVVLSNRGKYGSLEVISEETHDAILPTLLTPFFPDLKTKYGIGFQDFGQYLGPGSYGHAGGCGTLLVVNPDKRLVFAMARNGAGKDFQKHRATVMTLLRKWCED